MTKQSILGGTVVFDPQPLTSRETLNIQKICSALQVKETNLGITTTGTYNFGVSTKNCTETTFSAETVVATTIENTGSGFKFRRNDTNALFVFPNVETKTAGVMSTICQNTGAQVNQIKDGSGVVTTYATENVSDCTHTAQELCLLITKALPSGSNFEIVSKETIRFRVDTVNTPNGYWNYRKLQTNTGCAPGLEIDTIATLK